jgi:hypothetical protein
LPRILFAVRREREQHGQRAICWTLAILAGQVDIRGESNAVAHWDHHIAIDDDVREFPA